MPASAYDDNTGRRLYEIGHHRDPRVPTRDIGVAIVTLRFAEGLPVEANAKMDLGAAYGVKDFDAARVAGARDLARGPNVKFQAGANVTRAPKRSARDIRTLVLGRRGGAGSNQERNGHQGGEYDHRNDSHPEP